MPHNALTTTAVLALRALCYNAHRRFHQSLQAPQKAQDRLLHKIVHDLSRTTYGHEHHIYGIEGYDAFAERLPVQDYDSFRPWIEQQLSGETAITPHRVVHVEPTSGSSGATKSIPYTRPLLRAFSGMFRIWAYDLLSHGLEPETGRIFMSLSPAAGGGFTDDRDYLGFPLRQLLSPFLVMPPAKDMRSIARALMKERDLEVISVWSPSYLLEVMAQSPGANWRKLWPQLKLISCWDSAQAAPLADKVRAVFPDVMVQGKGLLATEGPLTIPLAQGCAPLVDSIFFEFEMPDGKIKRLHDLEPGERGEIIMTQRGGLTRYRLGDIVEAGNRIGDTPTLSFLGRSAACDLAGEKLNAVFVREALLTLLPDEDFILLPQERGYVLVTEQAPENLAEKADIALCSAYHYGVARRLGQLLPLQVMEVSDLYLKLRAFHQACGMKPGDIKDSALMTDYQLARLLLNALDRMQPLPVRTAA